MSDKTKGRAMRTDLSGTMLYDDVRRDVIRRIREAGLLTYIEAQQIAASAAHLVLGDVEAAVDRLANRDMAAPNSEGDTP